MHSSEPSIGLLMFVCAGTVSAPAIGDDGTAYVTSGGAQLSAVDATTGAELWTVALPAIPSAPTLDSAGVLYFAASDCNVYAVDTRSQPPAWKWAFSSTTLQQTTLPNTTWRRSRGSAVTVAASDRATCVMSSVVIGDEGTVFVVSNTGGLIAINDNAQCSSAGPHSNATAPLSWATYCGCVVIDVSDNAIPSVNAVANGSCAEGSALLTFLRVVNVSDNRLDVIATGAFAGAMDVGMQGCMGDVWRMNA